MNKIEDKIKIIPRNIISDKRGWFLKTIDGKESYNPFQCEVYITSAKPGESKGGHYHIKANEWFTLLIGEARLELMDLETNERSTLYLLAHEPQTIYVPTGIAHEFVNIGNTSFILLAFTDQQFVPSDTVQFVF